RLYHERIQLRMEQAEVETILARRSKTVESETAEFRKVELRKELGSHDDRLAIVRARLKVLDEELEKLAKETRTSPVRQLDLDALKDEIHQMEEASAKVAAELGALDIEFQAPARVRLIEEAAATPP